MAQPIGALVEQKVRTWFQDHPDDAQHIGAKVVLELTGVGGGKWLIDCSSLSIQQQLDAAGETVISMEAGTFAKLVAHDLSPESAFLTGQVKVEGDLGLAIKLGSLFS